VHDADRAYQERLLFTRYAAAPSPELRAALVERYLPLARQLARRYQRPDEPLEDLVQVASLGLVKAIDRFDPAREVAFSSYAVPTILGEIKRHFRDRTWAVRVPRDLQELALRAERAVTDLTRDLHRQPSARATIAQLMRTITPREREVLRLRFEEDLTQAEIGEIIGVSQMQVSRLIRQAVARLRLAARTAGAEAGPRSSGASARRR
jgi:RNA polymerase sigma-B factor